MKSEEQSTSFSNEDEPKVKNDKAPTAFVEDYRCVVCHKIFRGESKYNSHLITKHHVRSDYNIYKPYQCDKCDKAYTALANLKLHKVTHTGKAN